MGNRKGIQLHTCLLAGLCTLSLALAMGCSDKDPYIPQPVQITPIGDLPDLAEGQVVYIQGVCTMPTGVMVSGRYVKFHVQDDTGGTYVFADTEATVETQGYDGSSFVGVEVYLGEEVRIRGSVGTHDGMLEYYPVSGPDIVPVAYGRPVPAPHAFDSVDAVFASGIAYRGALVRVNDIVLQADPDTPWPAYGQKAKGLEFQGAGDANALGVDVYPGSGIPGSTAPVGDTDLVGVLHRNEEGGLISYTLYPRSLEDLNPLDAPVLTAQLQVYRNGQPEAQWVTVPLDTLPQCMYDLGLEDEESLLQVAEEAQAVVSLASLVLPEVVTDPRNWEYKIIASDGRQPFETLSFDQLKSGLLYAGEVGVNSHFYPGAGLSHIFYLNDLAKIVLYPQGGGPQPGEAEHGEGVNLTINEVTYPVNFADLPDPGADTRPLSDFVPDNIMDIYSMSNAFSYDQIRALYDFELVSFDGLETTVVDWDDVLLGAVDMTSGLPAVSGVTGGPIEDLFRINMIRKIIVDDGVVEEKLYWRDLPTQEVEGEQVVFFEDVLDAFDPDLDVYVHDCYLWASDDFGTWFHFGHGHAEDMYFNPLTNRGFVTGDWRDGVMPAYGGRFSSKAILRIELREVPQEEPAPEEHPVVCLDGLGCVSDPESGDTCNGCHVRRGSVSIPVNCASCH